MHWPQWWIDSRPPVSVGLTIHFKLHLQGAYFHVLFYLEPMTRLSWRDGIISTSQMKQELRSAKRHLQGGKPARVSHPLQPRPGSASSNVTNRDLALLATKWFHLPKWPTNKRVPPFPFKSCLRALRMTPLYLFKVPGFTSGTARGTGATGRSPGKPGCVGWGFTTVRVKYEQGKVSLAAASLSNNKWKKGQQIQRWETLDELKFLPLSFE